MRRSAIALALVAAVLGGGCRAGDEERAVDAVRGFVGALERGDGAAACAWLGEAGTSELLLAAVRAGTSGAGLRAPGTDRCAVLASRVGRGDATELATLRRAPVRAVRVDGDRATVATRAGDYELEELDGEWKVAALGPVAEAVAAALPPDEPVHLSVVRPKPDRPALGAASAARVEDATVEVSGTLDPADAELRVSAGEEVRVERLEARDGRFVVELALPRGTSAVVLSASAPEREPAEHALHLTRP